MTTARAARAWLACLLLLLLAQPAAAQTTRSTDAEPGHAWLLVHDQDDRWRLVHAPPREGPHAAEPGTVRAVRSLERAPDAILPCGRRVYLWYSSSDPRTPARLLTGRAEPAAGSLWAFLPDGALDPAPPLPAGWTVLRASGSLSGPALLATDAAGTLSLLRLANSEWRATPLPAVLTAARDRLRPIAWDDAPAIAELADTPTVWIPPPAIEGAWTPLPLAPAPGLAGATQVLAVGRQLIHARSNADTLELRALNARADRPLATIDRVPADPDDAHLALAPATDGWGRLLLLRRDTAWPAPPPALRLTELSLADGRPIFDDAPIQPMPISAAEFRLLAAILVLSMIAVVLLAMRTDLEDRPVVLPDDCALAEPWRRVLATAFDALLAAAITAKLFGVGMWGLLSLRILLEPGPGWAPVATLFLGAALVYGLCESLFAATPGKLLVGARVLACDPRDPRTADRAPRLPLGRALARSALKWLLPPMSAMALVSPDGRHRADQLTRAAVAVRLDNTPEHDEHA